VLMYDLLLLADGPDQHTNIQEALAAEECRQSMSLPFWRGGVSTGGCGLMPHVIPGLSQAHYKLQLILRGCR